VSDNPLLVMRELAKRSKGKISSITLYDANVCTTTHPASRPWELTVVSGEPFSKQLRYSHCGRKIRIFGNRYFLHVSIVGSLSARQLSVNERNLIDSPSHEAGSVALGNAIRYPLFTKTGSLSPAQRSLLENDELRSLLRELDLQTEERLIVSTDEISVYLKKPTVERVSSLIDRLADLINRHEITQEELDLNVLPPQFHPLIPLIKKWAIADDLDRENFLEKFTKAVLKRFVAEAEPYLRPIDSYLDSFGDRPLSEQACALGRLAECAVDAKRYLGGRAAER